MVAVVMLPEAGEPLIDDLNLIRSLDFDLPCIFLMMVAWQGGGGGCGVGVVVLERERERQGK